MQDVEKIKYIFQSQRLLDGWLFRESIKRMDAEKRNDPFLELTGRQFMAAELLQQRGRMTISDIAAELSISAPSASALMDRLEEKKVITREHDQKDRRKVYVRISDTAKKQLTHLDGIVAEKLQSILTKLDDGILDHYYEFSVAIRQQLEEEMKL